MKNLGISLLSFVFVLAFAGCASEGDDEKTPDCGPGTGIECNSDEDTNSSGTDDTASADAGKQEADTKEPTPDTKVETPVSNIPPPELISCVYPTKQLAEGKT